MTHSVYIAFEYIVLYNNSCKVSNIFFFFFFQLYEQIIAENEKLKAQLHDTNLELTELKLQLEKATQVRIYLETFKVLFYARTWVYPGSGFVCLINLMYLLTFNPITFTDLRLQ